MDGDRVADENPVTRSRVRRMDVHPVRNDAHPGGVDEDLIRFPAVGDFRISRDDWTPAESAACRID